VPAASPLRTRSAPAPAPPTRPAIVRPLSEPPPSRRLPPLYPYLRAVPDPRDARGVRHPLPAILGLVCLAMLSGIHGYLPAAEWGADLEVEERHALGFTRDTGPAASTLFEVLKPLSWEALETQLRAWAAAVAAAVRADAPTPPARPREWRRARRRAARVRFAADPEGLSLDGKTLRGSWKRGAEIAHMLAVVTHGLGLTVAQAPVSRKKGELTAIRPLLKQLVLEGLVVTVDAQFTQPDIARTILEGGGDYVMRVKENQPTLLARIETLLSPEHWEPRLRQSALTHEEGHGRIEERLLVVQSLRPGELEWPGAQQVFVVISRRVCGSGSTVPPPTLFYGVTSLRAEQAPPGRLLRLFRGHWTVENCAFWVRDVVLREDASTVRTGNLVAVLASLRGAILTLLRAREPKRPARQIRKLNASRKEALRALGCP
jgi:predicted transposase YbfD/YdcC